MEGKIGLDFTADRPPSTSGQFLDQKFQKWRCCQGYFQRHDAEKIFWMIKDKEEIKSSFTVVPDAGHQINVENPAQLNPVLQNILNKYN